MKKIGYQKYEYYDPICVKFYIYIYKVYMDIYWVTSIIGILYFLLDTLSCFSFITKNKKAKY